MVVGHMLENEAVRRHNYDPMGRCQDYDGVIARFTAADQMQCPRAVKAVVDACRSLRADALALELPEQAIVAAVNPYDGTYAAAICEPDALLSSIVRSLQVRLYSVQCVENPGVYMPAASVRAALGRWERQIALVFGRPYAAMLVASAVGTRPEGEMARDDLESIRLLLSSATGGCMFLEKVDK
jgi:hypothetical protein